MTISYSSTLLTKADFDWHPVRSEYPFNDLFDESYMPHAARARWRWYTIDLLDLVQFGAPRTERVSMHRAVHGLRNAGILELARQLPYEQPFAPEIDYLGLETDGVDLNQLNWDDDRWPSRAGRVLWFRLRPPSNPSQIPSDDQITILDDIAQYRPDAFLDFAEAVDHQMRWRTPMGRFLTWLLCGHKDMAGP